MAYAGFSKEGGRKSENNEDQKQKGLHSDLTHFSAQMKVKTKKKVFIQTQTVFQPKIQGGGHDSILRTILRHLCITGTPKGHDTMPPLNTPLINTS